MDFDDCKIKSAKSPNGAGGDGQSSTYEETNYDFMSENSESTRAQREIQTANGIVILRKKTTKKRFPLKKKKVLSRAGSSLDENIVWYDAFKLNIQWNNF